jgi:hypothetical protein
LEGVRVFDVRFGSSQEAARVLADMVEEDAILPTRDSVDGSAP